MEKRTITSWTQIVKWLEKPMAVCSYDWETTGLNYLEMEPLGLALCDGVETCYIPFLDHILLEGLMIIKRLFERDICWIAHNQSFDLKCCRKFLGAEPDNIWCTLVGAKLLDENRFGKNPYSLKTLAVDWLGKTEVVKYDEVAHDPTSRAFMDYAIDDAVNTYEIYQYEYPRLEKESLLYLAEEIEMPFQKSLADLEINGVNVDKEKLNEFNNECKTILLSLECSMLSLFSKQHVKQRGLFNGDYYYWSPINFGSSNQLITCIELLGFRVDEKTDKGNPSVGKVYLEKMKGKHDFFDLLRRYRKLQKLYNAFIEPADTFIDADGRIRPSYNLVRTGRLSCSNPNTQQLPNPKKEKLEFNYREIFVPGE